MKIRTNKKVWWITVIIFIVGIIYYYNAEAHEGFYIEAGVGKNDIFDKNDWEGRESAGCTFALGYVYSLNSSWYIDGRFSHFSQCTRGNGFDDRSEMTADNFYLNIRYYF